MAPHPKAPAPEEEQEAAVASVLTSALEAALGSAPPNEEEEEAGAEDSPLPSPSPPPLQGQQSCLPPRPSHHGCRSQRRGPDHYHRHAHPPDQPPRGVSEVFDRLVAGIIRPPRMIYDTTRALGPNPLLIPEQGIVAVRTDFEVTNARGQRVQASLWRALDAHASSTSSTSRSNGEEAGGWPCVVYLHGNSSSRVEAVKTQVLKAALAGGVQGVAAFDFSGCGLSGGEYVSLGWFEAHDCALVVRELRERHGVGPVVLWGRSMGAVTALLYASTGGNNASSSSRTTIGRRRRKTHQAPATEPAPVAGLILDSPFSSFKQLAVDLTTKGPIRIPRLAAAAVLGLVRRSVRKRAGFDLYHVNPLAHAPSAAPSISALFLAAEQDELIPPWHGEALEAHWPGPKLGLRFRGTHNSARPPIVYALASVFIRGAAMRARECPALAVPMALRLVERTAVVASQEEEALEALAGDDDDGDAGEDAEEDAAGGSGSGSRRERRRRRREERRRRQQREKEHPSPYQYGDGPAADTSGGGKKGRRKRKPPPAPRFVRAGNGSRGSLSNLPGATRALVAALDSSVAARAVEDYLLEELLRVGVAVVAADVRGAAKAEKSGASPMVAGTGGKKQAPPRLGEVALAQKEFADITAVSSSAAPALRAAAAQFAAAMGSSGTGRPATTWEGVLKAAEAEPVREKAATARALAGLLAAAAGAAMGEQEQQPASIKPPARAATVAPMPPAAAPQPDTVVVAASASRPRFCCFDPRDAHLSAAASAAQSRAAVKQRGLAAVAEVVFSDV